MFNLRLRPSLAQVSVEFTKAAPTLMVIYGALLTGLHSIPVRNPHANLERLEMLRQQLAFYSTLDAFLIYSLGKDLLRRKLGMSI